MADWMRAGSPLPQHLSRFLFLEDAVADRRVLEVGGADPGLAEFLLELGARRVVSAVDDPDRILALRAREHDRRIDYRVLREGILPGDDGAFDLVIDFDLPRALAAGDQWRIEDLSRVLSPEGFALSALENPEVVGLPGMFPQAPDAPQLGYRPFAEALVESFDVVQVYFQSLLLGYFFGSFDVDPGDDGIAPNTALMGESAEPASYYLFAFGPAVPVVEDVTLIQLPLAGMVKVAEESSRLEAPPSPPPDHAAAATEAEPDARTEPELSAESSVDLDDSTVDEATVVLSDAQRRALMGDPEATVMGLGSEVQMLRSALAEREHALATLAERLPGLRDHVHALVSEVERRTDERDRLTVVVEQLRVAVATRDAYLEDTALALDEARQQGAESLQLQRELEESVSGVAKQALVERDEARGLLEEAATEVQQLEAERDTLRQRAQALADELRAAREAAGAGDEVERLAAQARATEDSRRMLQETLEEKLHELDGAERRLAKAQAQIEELTAARDALGLERQRVEQERKKLAAGVNTLVKERQDAKARLAAAEQRIVELEKAREGESAEQAEEAKVAGRAAQQALQGRLAALKDERDEAKHLLVQTEEELVGLRDRLKGAQAALEERSQELGKAREAFQEAASQRDTLHQVVVSRDRDLTDLRRDLEAVVAGRDRLAAETDALKKALAEAETRADGLVGERDHARRQVAVAAREAQEVARARDQALASAMERARALEDLETKAQSSAEREASVSREIDALRHGLAEAEQAIAGLRREVHERDRLVAEGEELVEAQDKKLAARHQEVHDLESKLLEQEERISWLNDERAQMARAYEQATEALTAEQRALAEAQELARQRASNLEGQLTTLRGALDTERDQHERTRDSLAETTKSLEHVVERGESLERELISLHDVVEEARLSQARVQTDVQRLEHVEIFGELLQGTLDEAQRALIGERARGDLLAEHLVEAQETAEQERARGDLLSDHLVDAQRAMEHERARGDLLSEQLAEAQRSLEQERAARDLLAASLVEAQVAAEHERDRGALLFETLAEARAASTFDQGRASLFSAQLSESQSALKGERARSDMLAGQLDEAQAILVDMASRVALLQAQLEEAQEAAHLEALEADLTHDVLEEAQGALAAERARADLMKAQLQEAQATLLAGEARLSLVTAQLDEMQSEASDLSRARSDSSKNLAEAEQSLLQEFARRDQLQTQLRSLEHTLAEVRSRAALSAAQLEEAQSAASAADVRAELLSAQLEDARAEHGRQATQGTPSTTAGPEASAEIASLEERVDRQQSTIDLLRADVATARAEARELEAERAPVADVGLQERLASLEDIVEKVEARASEWEQRALEADAALERAKLDHVQDLAAIRAATEAPGPETVRALEENGELKSAVGMLEAQLADAKLALEEGGAREMREELRMKSAALSEAEVTIASLERARLELETDLGRTREELDAAQDAVERQAPQGHAGGNGDLEQEAQALRARVAELDQQLGVLRDDLDEKNDRINRLTQRLVAVEGL